MNPKTLFIYEYQILYEILNEIKEYLDFEIINLKKDKVKKIEFNKFESFLIISSDNNQNFKNILILNEIPIKFDKLIQSININFLKNSFAKKSDIKIGKYNLDLNSRKIILENQSLNLTEKETEVIIFIKSNENVSIKDLQNNVWGYNSDLETHTVETHIYRLRKKMKEKFKDENFIYHTKNGYKII